jgi:hypothetical protein
MSLKRKPRITCPHCGSVYVIEKEGDPEASIDTEQPAPEASPYTLPPRSHDWFAMFFRLRGRASEAPLNIAPLGKPAKIIHRRARQMLSMAQLGVDSQCEQVDRPTEEERAALVKIAVASDASDAWRRVLADEGYRGFAEDGSVYLWVPSRWPPGHGPPREAGELETELAEHGEAFT